MRGEPRLVGISGSSTFRDQLNHSASLLEGCIQFGHEVVRAQLELAPALQEVAVLRVAALRRCEYEWAHHIPMAQTAGLNLADIATVRDAPEQLGEPLRSVARYAEAVDRDEVSDDSWTAIALRLSPREAVELTMLSAAYSMFCRAENALRPHVSKFQGFDYPPAP
jgi:4-carboxymuconolactone decarboxylase